MADLAAIGTWLRERRAALQLSRPALAARSHCAAATIKKLEEGRRSPSVELAAVLVRALEIPVGDQADAVHWLRGQRLQPPGAALASVGASVAPDAAETILPRRSQPPRPLTPLIGRDHERAAVVALLGQTETRLVTLTGEGGMGKSRLALAVTSDLATEFADGIGYVDLAPLRDPTLLPVAIAAALGISEIAQQSVLTRLADVLGPQDFLLVLDNFESVLAAAPLLSDLLRAAPRLKALVTSRAVLQVEGEQVYRLSPLPALAAQALFVARARMVHPALELTAENERAIAAICARLDGLPLAVELAAAHSRLLAPPALLAQLEPRLPLLVGGRSDSPPRQRALRLTLDWSYARLAPAEQRLFEHLAVFAGGAPLDAVLVVHEADRAQTILEAEALLNNSLLRTDEGTAAARFTMLETVREYAGEQLLASGEHERVHQAHAEYFAALVERAGPALRGTQPHEWLDRLQAEHANLRAALGWALQHVPALGARLAGALWPFWVARGHWSEGRQALEAAQASAPGSAPQQRAVLLEGAGTLARLQGEHQAAHAWLSESLGLYQDLGDRRGAAACLYGLADIARSGGEREQSTRLGAESLTLYRAAGDPVGIIDALLFCADEGDDDEAGAARYQEALELARAQLYLPGIALATHRLAGIAEGQGDLVRAVSLYEESLGLFRTLGDQRRIATVVEVLGEIALSLGDMDRARACFAESQTRYRQLGARDGLLSVAYNLANVEQAAEQWAVMAVYAAQGLAEARAVGNRAGIRDGLLLLGHAQLHLSQPDAALAAYGEALRYVTERTRPKVLAPLLVGFAMLAAAEGQLVHAAACLGAAEIQGALSAHDQFDFDHTAATVRSSLDAATCEATWARGHAWSAADIASFPWTDLWS